MSQPVTRITRVPKTHTPALDGIAVMEEAVCGCTQTSMYVHLSYGVPALPRANSGASY